MPEKKVNFYSLFRTHDDGSIEPVCTVRIGGVQVGPGVRFSGSVRFGNINLFDYIGHDFSVEEQNGISIIVGIY